MQGSGGLKCANQCGCGLDTGGETFLVFGELAKVALRLYAMPERIRLAEERTERMDMAGVMDLRPCTISLIARGATPMARAMAFWEIPMGLRYSSSRISPGVTGVSMAGACGCECSLLL